MDDFIPITDEYAQTLANYNAGIAWHKEKTLSYDWTLLIERFVPLLKGTRVLDVGCGVGRDIEEFRKKGIVAEGLDFSEEAIRSCQERFPVNKFHVGNIINTGLPADSYDGIWACASLLNIRKLDMPVALAGFRKILQPDGILFASVKEGEGEKLVEDKAGKRLFSFYSMEELSSAIKETGFQIVHSETVQYNVLTKKTYAQEAPTWLCVYARNQK